MAKTKTVSAVLAAKPPVCSRLSELEAVIESGVRTYIEVGKALKEISEQRLYREQGFETFENYCRERWRFARQTAYDYVAAYEVSGNVRAPVQIPAMTHAVELARLPADQQQEVAEAIGGQEITSRQMREIVQDVKAGTEPAAAVQSSTESAHAVCAVCGNNPPTLNHTWCSACKAAAEKQNQDARISMALARGYAKGIESLREMLSLEFARLNQQAFKGCEIAYIIRTSPAPPLSALLNNPNVVR